MLFIIDFSMKHRYRRAYMSQLWEKKLKKERNSDMLISHCSWKQSKSLEIVHVSNHRWLLSGNAISNYNSLLYWGWNSDKASTHSGGHISTRFRPGNHLCEGIMAYLGEVPIEHSISTLDLYNLIFFINIFQPNTQTLGRGIRTTCVKFRLNTQISPFDVGSGTPWPL